MKTYRRIFSVFLAAVFAFATIPTTAFALGVGITPPTLEQVQVLRGIERTASFLVFKDPDDFNREIDFIVESRGEYSDLVTLERDFVIPAGQSSGRYQFLIAPEDAPNGEYEVEIVFSQVVSNDDAEENADEDDTTAGFSVIPGVVAKVEMVIGGDEVVEYSVNGLQVQLTEIDDPIIAQFSVDNTGNVSWKPSSIDFFMQDTDDPSNTYEGVIEGSDISEIVPGSNETLEITLPVEDVVAAEYELVFTVNDEPRDESIVLDSQPFTLLPPDTLNQNAEVLEVAANKSDAYQIGERALITTTVQNTGDIRVEAVMVTEVFKDDSLLDILRSDEIAIDKNEVSELSQAVTLDSAGEYRVETYVEYGNKRTTRETMTLQAGSDFAFLYSTTFAYGVLAVVIVGIGLFVVVYKRRKTNLTKAE